MQSCRTFEKGQPMNQDWQLCTEPEAMIARLKGTASNRQLRLFACACCRLIWPLIGDKQLRTVVETAERYADGLVGPAMLEAAKRAAPSVPRSGMAGWLAAWAALEAAGEDAKLAAAWAPVTAAEAAAEAAARSALAIDATAPAEEVAASVWRS